MEDGPEEVVVEKVSSLVNGCGSSGKDLRSSAPVNGSVDHHEDEVFLMSKHEKDEVFLDVESLDDDELVPVQVLEVETTAGKEEEEEECLQENFALNDEIDGNGRRSAFTEVSSEVLASVKMVKECLLEIADKIDAKRRFEGGDDAETRLEDDLKIFLSEMKRVRELGKDVKSMFMEYEEMRKKEKKESENSIVSLTEENQDICNLLKVAVVEKESVEKSLNRLKGGGEQKRVPILQIAERGLQKVGFGFMMGSLGGECASDNPGSSSASTKSDGSEVEEESISLATAVEMIMKNLRLENAELRKALQESRSDSEHLQCLTEKQAQEINECTLYIKNLEERESLLNQNVADLVMELKEAEEEVLRWREACELEVEAGKCVIEEHERKSAILQEDLNRTKTALDNVNKKLMLKEKLATAAMAAQAAAETSLRMADSRSVVLRERIEELTKQLEEEPERGRKEKGGSRRKLRHLCWPWQAFRIISPASRGQGRNPHRRIPEMMALLQ